MRSMVVLFALVSAACGTLVPTTPLWNTHSVLAPAVVAAPVSSVYVGGSAVTHQERVDVSSSPAVVSQSLVAPVWNTHETIAPVLAHSASVWGAHASPLLAGHGHYLKKRSLGWGVPLVTAHVAPSAVSHQSRVDVISSPAVVSHAVAAPVLSHAVTPVVSTYAPAAVSHQSRVDYRSSPAVVSQSVIAPVHAAPWAGAHSWAAPSWESHGHLLKKRSLGWAAPWASHYAPAVSHQSRVDVIESSPVVAHVAPIAIAPVAVAHAAPAVSHQSRVDVISSDAHLAPVGHSAAVWGAPIAQWGHSGLGHW